MALTSGSASRIAAAIGDAWFRTLAESTTTAVYIYDQERFLYVNRATEALTGLPADELLATSPVALVHPDHRAEAAGRLARRLRGEEAAGRFELKLLTAAGERWVEASADAVRLDGRLVSLGTAVDITDRRRAQEALERERERAQVTLASIGDGVIRTDARGRVDFLNPVAERLTGWSREEALGRPVEEVFRILDEAGGEPLPSPVAACLCGAARVELDGAALLVGRGGAEHLVQDSVAPIPDGNGGLSGAVLVFKDVTELRGLEREMTYLASHDPLTGLINRGEFEAGLRRCLRTARDGGEEHALCYLDLDEFKVINDTVGHVAGDEMLRQVAAALAATVPAGDTLGRLGGDEFGVLIENAPAEAARERAERLRAAVEGLRFAWQGSVFEPRVSIGLVPIAGGGDPARVLAAADAACYVAKERGGNRVHEAHPDDRALAERHGEMQWIHRIHKAFEEERFCLYAQPIVPLRAHAGLPPMIELLLRMRDGDGGLVLPGAIVAAAERYHLIRSIDRWVVAEALRILAGRLDDGDFPAGTRFCINISGQSMDDESFLDHVLAGFEASGVDPRRICFEVTETAAVGHLARAMRFIAALKRLGASFVLDDFGSGLSSFAYLKNLRVDYLKIAGDFVRGLSGGRVERAMVAAIHQVGSVMRIRTIAEGIESAEALEVLREIGIDYAQGFLLREPEPLAGGGR
jgi:diguanylate cyclase (GGDEF)-like protein/PAS domain S-box-containing protein